MFWARFILLLSLATGSVPAAEPATARFERAQLMKPRALPPGLAGELAPLLLREVPGTNPPPQVTNVFFHLGAVEWQGRTRAQLSYWWRREASPTAAGGREDWVGLRLTLDAHGVPAIFEVGDGRRLTAIYVNESVERAARAEFGGPLPGRRFVVEAPTNAAPLVAVPRLLADPPAVMGPIVYLRGDGEVATVICRCMPSEARTLAGQSFYELVAAETSSNTPDATRLEAAKPRWLREDFLTQTNRLSPSLRLPRDF